MDPTETVDQIKYVGGFCGGERVSGKCMGALESACGHFGSRKEIIIDPEAPNMEGGVYCSLKAQVTDLAISL